MLVQLPEQIPGTLNDISTQNTIRFWFLTFVSDTNEGKDIGRCPWEKQHTLMKAYVYCNAAMFMDLMTVDTAGEILSELIETNNTLGIDIFLRGLTGEYRGAKYRREVSLHPDLEILCHRREEINTPQENAQILKELAESKSFKYPLSEVLGNEDREYLQKHLPSDFSLDSKEKRPHGEKE